MNCLRSCPTDTDESCVPWTLRVTYFWNGVPTTFREYAGPIVNGKPTGLVRESLGLDAAVDVAHAALHVSENPTPALQGKLIKPRGSDECYRIAFAGASGTGKSTLANFLKEELGLELNPVGSRSVSAAMGFSSPYDVDAAGKRAEFQRRLLTEKVLWEKTRAAFVTDRTPLDNLAYQALHDVHSVTADLYKMAVNALSNYTHIFYCPVSVFCQLDDDPARVGDKTYHELYDTLLKGLLYHERFETWWCRMPFTIFGTADLAERKKIMLEVLHG